MITSRGCEHGRIIGRCGIRAIQNMGGILMEQKLEGIPDTEAEH